MAISEPDAGRGTIPAGAPSGSRGLPAGQAESSHAEVKEAEARRAETGQTETGQTARPSPAVVIVPTLLGLLGFFAVAAAVTAEAATVNVTVPGMLLAVTALVVAGVSPLYARNLAWLSLCRPAVLLMSCLLVEAALFLFAPQLVLFSVPALPLALGGGAVLLATSLWGQLRKGPAAEPVLLHLRESPPRPFTSTLLVVAVNWALFLAAGAFCAWLLLGD